MHGGLSPDVRTIDQVLFILLLYDLNKKFAALSLGNF